MEDGFVFVDSYGGKRTSAFFAVYDGHGGRQVVDFVTAQLHEILLQEMQKASIPDALRNAFESTDHEIVRRNIMTSGCTACVCVLAWATDPDDGEEKRMVFTAHLGDSRAVMSRRGIATRLTSMTDHKATDPLEAKRVIEAGGKIINDRVNGMLAMTRALGDHLLKMPVLPNDIVSNWPDISSIFLTQEDRFIILACDGLWDVMNDQQAVEAVVGSLRELEPYLRQLEAEGRCLAEILARMLVEEALALGSTDNISVVVIFL